MRFRPPSRRSRSAAVLGSAGLVVALLAATHDGYPAAQVDLDDGSVWVTSSSEMALGRLNSQIGELTGGVLTTTPTFDVLQDGATVLLHDQAASTLSVLDPAAVELGTTLALPPDAVVSMRAGVVAVLDPTGGDLWVRGVDDLAQLRLETDPADVELGAGGAAAVGTDGAVHAVSATGATSRVRARPGDAAVVTAGADLGPLRAPLQVSAVGPDAVVLDGAGLHARGSTTRVPGEGLVLQQPGPAARTALVASTQALVEVPLDGGGGGDGAEPASVPARAQGLPAAPVRVDGCAHAAWASTPGSYLRSCEGGEPELQDVPEVGSASQLVFRVNRSVVVLNDITRGDVWLLDEDLVLVRGWDAIAPEDQQQEQTQTAESAEQQQATAAQCTEDSAPPRAVADAFGVRAGRSTLLPVIDNDLASACGVLTVSAVDPLPPVLGGLQPVYGGRALQVDVPEGATGRATVPYTISDGRGASAPSTADLTVEVRPPGVNAAPLQLRQGALAVEQGASASRAVLADFLDPDGDDLVLTSAVAEGGGAVRFQQDGQVTFTADAGALGRQRVSVVVSDGVLATEGELVVDVRPRGSLAPVLGPVQAVTSVDAPVVVRPLDAATSPSGEPLRLAGVGQVPGLGVEPDLAAGTFTVTAPLAGTYYVGYVVTATPQQATGLARIDVRERPEDAAPPVAVRDVARLPLGGEVAIDPLANDSDPAGGVLVLQSVEAPEGSGVRAVVVDHHLVRISAERALDSAVRLTYTVSNGAATSRGDIVVQPVPAAAGQQAPVASAVEVSVRTGGVVTIPVLDHVQDPDGDAVHLVGLAEEVGEGQGLLFVAQDELRFQAPATPMTVHAVYRVQDAAGNEGSAQVTVEVHASDPATKAPPRPQPLTARVYAGETVRVPVPLTGIDDDGDGVVLLGEAEPPAKGRIVGTGADWLEYEALPGESGTDTFTYAVEDWVGQRAVGTVRVGVSPRPTTSLPPAALDESVTLRPGQGVEVRVLANDVDPDGGELALEPELEVPEGLSAVVSGRRVVVSGTGTEGTFPVVYTVSNARGGRATGVLTVTVAADAPLRPPVARDVVVAPLDTLDRSVVQVDVLAVADNPSGPLSDLAVSVPASASATARVTADQRVAVTLVDRAQTLPFLLTNTTDPALSSYAFITVPALGDFPPVLRPGAPALEVLSGQELRVSLQEQVQVAAGRSPRVTDPTAVRATKADGSSLVADEATLLYRSQAGYSGPASLTVEVTDGTSRQDPSGRTKVLTLPITVLPLEEVPPTFAPSVLDVAPGEAPVRVDLRAFTLDAAGAAEHTYRLVGGAPAGFSVSLSGTTLSVSAQTGTPRGSRGSADVTIGYGGGAGTVSGRVELRVVASSRPLARVPDLTVPDGSSGRERAVDVLAGAFNPFPGTPLELLSAVVETPGSGTARVAGSSVVAVPGERFTGPMTVRYRVRDATSDADREVEGRVTVVVRGRPAAPPAPRVVEVRDGTVVLAWDAPANNGAPITEYRLTDGSGRSTSCASTTCTVTGLTNDVDHVFRATATNAVGESEPGPASAPARPDTRPERPAAPALEFGDRSVTATWAPAASRGSAVTGYTLEISPAPPGGRASVAVGAVTSYTWTGLTNGQAYTVRVRAQNRAPQPSDWSPDSAPQTPAAPPAPPGVTATRVDTELGGQIDVRWSRPADGGDPVRGYELEISGGGAPLRVDVDSPDQLGYAFNSAQNGVSYTFTVRAENKAGSSPVGTATARTFSRPGPVVDLRAEAASGDAEAGRASVLVRWTPPRDSGGEPVTEYQVRMDGGEWRSVGGQTSATFEGLAGGRQPTFTVRASNGYWSQEETTTTREVLRTRPGAARSLVVAAGAPGSREVAVSWQPPADTGGLAVRYSYEVQERRALVGGWRTTLERQTGDTSFTHRAGEAGAEVRVVVTARNDAGEGPDAEAEGRAAEEPAGDPPPG